MVPNGWNSKPLVQLLDKIIDYRGQSVPKATSGIPLITARNVRDGYLDFSNQEYIEESKFNEWMTRGTPQKGDILFTTEAPLGKACRYPKTGVYGVGQRTVTLRTNNKLDSEFLLYTILSERGQLLIDLRSSGSTAKGIKSSELKKVKITYPESLPEQRKIAQILSTWDKAIATTEKLIDASKQQKKALMQQLLTGKKRLVDPETGKAYEGDWEEVKLGEISYITTGNSNREDSSLDAEYTFFDRSEDIRKSSRYLFDSEAVIVAGEGQDFIPKYFKGKFDLHQRTYAIMNFEKSVGKFLYYYIGFTRHYFLSQAVGSTVKSLRLPMFQKMPIQLPSKDEQQKIASVLTAADKEIELLEAKLAHFKQEKKALMQQLLTGKRRVKVAETEAA
ncbi:restriction endonuclease subunit S [Vibrio nigripulchritudo]|uniref:restriction endonuclease subunit S n=1 Tax=Vibrio nigripulchritudo TaxID=28173 RepID=UPI0003B1B200|nr:restriction endonuclease subunit S [Vibrio nigripulchritudo]CCN94626.1 Type I DNA specificity S subunit [Vibrio nigripulchritudo ENn2]